MVLTYINKAVGYHQYIFRLLILVKMPFKKIKAFFFKKLSFIFSNFSNFKIFKFLPKNLTIQVEKNKYFDIISFDLLSTTISSPSTTLTKFKFSSEKTQVFFRKKIKLLHVLTNLTISVTFYGKFARRGAAALQYFQSAVGRKCF